MLSVMVIYRGVRPQPRSARSRNGKVAAVRGPYPPPVPHRVMRRVGWSTTLVENDPRKCREVRMLGVLPAQLPWWVTGPGVGLCVVALYGVANLRLGVSGAWLAATVAPMERWRGERWRVVFLVGLVAGA